MKKEIKIGDRIRCASYVDMAFKAQELADQGFIYKHWRERSNPAEEPKLYIEVVDKAEEGRRGFQTRERN